MNETHWIIEDGTSGYYLAHDGQQTRVIDEAKVYDDYDVAVRVAATHRATVRKIECLPGKPTRIVG